MADKWIAKAIKPENKGKLRAKLGAKEGRSIPVKKLNAAAKKGGVLGREARLAKTLKKLHK